MSHDNDRTGQSSYHTHNFDNTAGRCSCGEQAPMPRQSTTAGDVLILTPFTIPLPYPQTETLPHEANFPDPVDDVYSGDKKKVNMGSPVGPGFVVYERAPGQYGYDVKMARGSIGPGWRHLVQCLFDHIEHDKKWNPTSGFASAVVTQVKEKFGALRIYFHTTGTGLGGYSAVEGYVDALTAVSCKMCEACGAPGKSRGPGRTWILTLCDACDKLSREELRALFEKTEQSE